MESITNRPDLDALPSIVTVQIAADTLGVCSNTVYKMIHIGRIPCLRVGRCIRIPKETLISCLSAETSPHGCPHRHSTL